jgi:hypothetical protein
VQMSFDVTNITNPNGDNGLYLFQWNLLRTSFGEGLGNPVR